MGYNCNSVTFSQTYDQRIDQTDKYITKSPSIHFCSTLYSPLNRSPWIGLKRTNSDDFVWLNGNVLSPDHPNWSDSK